MPNTNLALWDAVSKTDPAHVKPITGKSYKGNSPRPHYLIHHATETFGPIGIGWGFEIIGQEIIEGALIAPDFHEQMHTAKVRVWYDWNGKRGTVEHVGGTMFSGKYSSGKTFTDEDAPKKSVTDALVKALSMIGFAGDIFLGRYDDSKYVSEITQEFREEERNGRSGPATKRTREQISQEANRKRQDVRDYQNDINQIETLPALARFEREVLTPDTMASLGMKQYVVEEAVGKRRQELERETDVKPDFPDVDAKRRDFLIERIQQMSDEDALIALRDDDDEYKRVFEQLPKPMQIAVRKAGATKLEALRMANMSTVEAG